MKKNIIKKNEIILSLIFPSYNEEKNLKLLLTAFKNLIKNRKIEIIVVENGSKDNSRNLLKKLEKQIQFLKVIYLKKNKGYGHGVFEGLKKSKGEFVGWAHGDLQYSPKEIMKVLKIIYSKNEENIYIKGLRQGRSFVENMFTFGMSLLETLYFRTILWDINAQPNIFHRNFLKKIKRPPKDFSFDLYVYFLAKKNNLKIIRLPIKFPPRIYGKSNWNLNFFSRLNFIKRTLSYSLKLKKSL